MTCGKALRHSGTMPMICGKALRHFSTMPKLAAMARVRHAMPYRSIIGKWPPAQQMNGIG